MRVESSRFGIIEADDDAVITFPHGLIGFESSRSWILIPDSEASQVAWLQSVTRPQVALPLVSPRRIVPDYKVSVSERQLTSLAIRSSDQIFILAIVSKSGHTLTLNLRSPIVINATRRLGAQIVSEDNLPLALPLTQSTARTFRMAA
ncbi:MAG: flagellar assembly factor FliW [Pirellulaceae bacterium]|nr:MAG: flagellar assembly factor FliW [Pirellulaceae bacterium]